MTITLITGANKGLGRETARRLLEIGHTVLIGARDAERGKRTAGELGGVFLKIDPMSDESVAAAVGQVENDYGGSTCWSITRAPPNRASARPTLRRRRR
jgi:NAD(P)-dependent dehydrogenase (short-subunit alcohol dehydrogenase family)